MDSGVDSRLFPSVPCPTDNQGYFQIANDLPKCFGRCPRGKNTISDYVGTYVPVTTLLGTK